MLRTSWPRRPNRAVTTSRSTAFSESRRCASTRIARRSSSASPATSTRSPSASGYGHPSSTAHRVMHQLSRRSPGRSRPVGQPLVEDLLLPLGVLPQAADDGLLDLAGHERDADLE